MYFLCVLEMLRVRSFWRRRSTSHQRKSRISEEWERVERVEEEEEEDMVVVRMIRIGWWNLRELAQPRNDSNILSKALFSMTGFNVCGESRFYLLKKPRELITDPGISLTYVARIDSLSLLRVNPTPTVTNDTCEHRPVRIRMLWR